MDGSKSVVHHTVRSFAHFLGMGIPHMRIRARDEFPTGPGDAALGDHFYLDARWSFFISLLN